MFRFIVTFLTVCFTSIIVTTFLLYEGQISNIEQDYNAVIDKKERKISSKTEVIEKTKSKVKHIKEDKKQLKGKVEKLDSKIKKLNNKINEIKEESVSHHEVTQHEVSYNSDTEVKTSSSKVMYVTATAYTSMCDSGCTGITATGVNVRSDVYYKGKRIIAVDPDVIPLGSLVKVYPKTRSPFIAYAKDTGGAIDGRHIDFLISTTNESKASHFGRQKNVKIKILRLGK